MKVFTATSAHVSAVSDVRTALFLSGCSASPPRGNLGIVGQVGHGFIEGERPRFHHAFSREIVL